MPANDAVSSQFAPGSGELCRFIRVLVWLVKRARGEATEDQSLPLVNDPYMFHRAMKLLLRCCKKGRRVAEQLAALGRSVAAPWDSSYDLGK